MDFRATSPASRQPGRLFFALLCLVTLAVCPASAMARAKLVAPGPISKLYSEVDMQMDLVGFDHQDTNCATETCAQEQTFEQRVEETGGRLAQAAFGIMPELGERVEQFEFVVADKQKPGSTSNASGKIVIFRGINALKPDDIALSFLIAREMGRVIGQHHDENSATRILVSVIAGVLFPASNLFSTSAVSQTAYSSTLATTAASTATSLVGSKLALNSLKPDQMNEADSIALGLLEHIGIKPHQVVASLAQLQEIQNKDGWARDFYASAKRVGEIKETIPENHPAQVLAAIPEAAPPKHVESPVRVAVPDTPVRTVQISEPSLEIATPEIAEPEAVAGSETSVAVAPAVRTAIKMAKALPKTVLKKKEGAAEKPVVLRKQVAKTGTLRVVAKVKNPVQLAAKATLQPLAQKSLTARVGGQQPKHSHLAKSMLHDTTRIKKSIKAAAHPPKPVL